MTERCNCGYELVRDPYARSRRLRLVCRSCQTYYAAVAAQQAAAVALATTRRESATGAWLNEHGVFAWVDGIVMQLGTKAEAAPFVALTSIARDVKVHWDESHLALGAEAP